MKAIYRQRDFQRAIQPLIDNAVRLTAYYTPTILIYPDGRIERQDHPKVTEILEQTSQLVAQVASSYMNSNRRNPASTTNHKEKS